MSRQPYHSNQFDVDGLIEKACTETGLTDFGDVDIGFLLGKLLDRVTGEIKFKEGGRENYLATINRILTNRLRMHKDIKQHPEILQEEIRKPIIILGLPRTGTTKLQRMITASQDVQKLPLWRMLNPAPFSGVYDKENDPRITAVVQGEVGSDTIKNADAFQAAHHLGMTEVEEDIILFDHTLEISVAGLCSFLPFLLHNEWLAGCEERDVDRKTYADFHRFLQYLQWQDGGHRDRPWVLKAPSHNPHLVALVETFPDAILVQSHRDPCKVVPSAAKLMTSLWSVNADFDVKAVGLEMYHWLRLGMNRLLCARSHLELDDRIIDVRYDDIRANIMPVIEEIFERHGSEISEQAKKAMLAWETDNEQGKHGRHSYALEEFDLTKEIVQTSFSEYIKHFSSYF